MIVPGGVLVAAWPAWCAGLISLLDRASGVPRGARTPARRDYYLHFAMWLAMVGLILAAVLVQL